MFKKDLPLVYAHSSVLDEGNYVLPDVILNKNETEVNLFRRFCPHRMYPLHEPGDIVQDIHCKFHNFNWDKNGIPINNSKKLNCGSAVVGKTNLVMNNFVEPDHKWVHDLSKETDLKYSHFCQGESDGSWLWLMDAEADLLHVYMDGIHPFLSRQVKLDDMNLDQGDGWIYQEHPDGWWVYLFPYIFLEYGYDGKLGVNRVIPKNENTEYGFTWTTQFYYNSDVSVSDRMVFETMEDVFREDVGAAEKQKGNYFPLMSAMNKWENHCVHFGKWYRENVDKK